MKKENIVSPLTGNTKGGKYHCTIDLLLDWFGLVCFANEKKIVSCHTADSKPVKHEVNGTVILHPLVLSAFKGSFTLANLQKWHLLYLPWLPWQCDTYKQSYLCFVNQRSQGQHSNCHNRTARIRHKCRKTTVSSSLRCLINTGVEKMNYILI